MFTSEIRKVLIKNKNALDAVIGLPANLFYGTRQAEFTALDKLQNEAKEIDKELNKYFPELGLK